MHNLNKLPAYFSTVANVMVKYMENAEDHWTLQTEGGPYVEGPYVQALQEHDNMLLVEATSSNFLEPPLTQEQHEVMLFLGWRHFPEEMYPNYSQILDQSKVSPKEIAEMLTKTLHFAYGVDDSFSFEIAPFRSDAAILIHEEESVMSIDDFVIERIRKPYPSDTPVVPFSTPIVSFGNPKISRVATVGINPSRKEFEGRLRGVLLEPESKRLVDLSVLELETCESMTQDQARLVLEGCFDYFTGKNYFGEWFDPLEQAVLNPIDASYFGDKLHTAVHLDLVQWATDPVWSGLEDREIASFLLEDDADFLRQQLDTYDFTFVFLNGKEVCDQIQNLGIYRLKPVGELPWNSGERNRTSKIYSAIGPKGEIVVGWTLNIQGMQVSSAERIRIYAELGKWIQVCINANGSAKSIVGTSGNNLVTVGYEDLAEAIINIEHFQQNRHPDYWTTFIDLLRAELEISKGQPDAIWLDEVLEFLKLTTRLLPTDYALELSADMPLGAAADETYKKFSDEIERMRQDLVDINREFIRVLIRETLGENSNKRIPMNKLIEMGLPEREPSWTILDWYKEQ